MSHLYLSLIRHGEIEIFLFRSYWLTIRCKSYNGDRATLKFRQISHSAYNLRSKWIVTLSENKVALQYIMDKLQILIKLW